jgi:hypothetical protein
MYYKIRNYKSLMEKMWEEERDKQPIIEFEMEGINGDANKYSRSKNGKL